MEFPHSTPTQASAAALEARCARNIGKANEALKLRFSDSSRLYFPFADTQAIASKLHLVAPYRHHQPEQISALESALQEVHNESGTPPNLRRAAPGRVCATLAVSGSLVLRVHAVCVDFEPL